MSVLVTVGALVAIALWAIASYHKLVRLRTEVTRRWRVVDSQLKRRHELASSLVNEVKDVADLDREPVEALAAARNRAAVVTGPADAGRKETELSAALGRLLALVQGRVQLSANERLRIVKAELASAESAIGPARQSYNDVAASYNRAAEVIPGNIVAGFAGFRPAELFQGESGSDNAGAAGSPSNES